MLARAPNPRESESDSIYGFFRSCYETIRGEFIGLCRKGST